MEKNSALNRTFNHNQNYNQNININRNNNGNRGRYRFLSLFRRLRFGESVFPRALAGNRARYPSRKPDQGGRRARLACRRSCVSLPVKVVNAQDPIGRVDDDLRAALGNCPDPKQERLTALNGGRKR